MIHNNLYTCIRGAFISGSSEPSNIHTRLSYYRLSPWSVMIAYHQWWNHGDSPPRQNSFKDSLTPMIVLLLLLLASLLLYLASHNVNLLSSRPTLCVPDWDVQPPVMIIKCCLPDEFHCLVNDCLWFENECHCIVHECAKRIEVNMSQNSESRREGD